MRTGFPRAVVDLLTLRKPVVGIVQGYAVGAGLDLALACDFRFSDPKAKYGAVYVTRGLGGGSTYSAAALRRPRPRHRDAADGPLHRDGGSAPARPRHRGRAAEELESRAYELAGRLAKGPTQAYGAIKNARNQGLGLDPVKGFEAQILANVELMFHKDAREGPRAFKEGREPNYTAEWIDLQYDPLRPYE